MTKEDVRGMIKPQWPGTVPSSFTLQARNELEWWMGPNLRAPVGK